MKPIHTFLLLAVIGALVSATVFLFPENGIKVTEDFTIEFLSWKDLKPDSNSLEMVNSENLAEYLNVLATDVDSLDNTDSLVIAEVKTGENPIKLILPKGDISPLENFFQALDSIETQQKIRILHFGDSQIESDRISGYVRNELQKKFGGEGCGILPLYTKIPVFSMSYKNVGEWKRYSVYGKKDPSVKHNRFGLTGSFERFSPMMEDSLLSDTLIYTASVSYSKNERSYNRNSRYKRARMYFGFNRRPFTIESYVNGELLRIDSILPMEGMNSVVYDFTDTPDELTFRFQGSDSPEFYGISFESDRGVFLDNLAMRGCSGTIFTKMNKGLLRELSADMNVSLVILQYGGNAIPYLHDSLDIAEYGMWYQSHISYLKKMYPQSSFLLIGPSDMGEKDGTEMVTRKNLVEVNNELKRIADKTGSAYWDLFEVMGGQNSMKEWVEADPPLAAKDYTHFSSRGARKIGELFYKSINDEYEHWKSEKTNL